MKKLIFLIPIIIGTIIVVYFSLLKTPETYELPKCNETIRENCDYKGVKIISNLDSLLWMKENVPSDSVVLSWWNYGKELEKISGLGPVIKNPSQFLFDSGGVRKSETIKEFEPEEKFNSVAQFFTTDDEAIALDIAKKYYVDYVFITKDDSKEFPWINFIAGQRASIRVPKDVYKNPGIYCLSKPKTEPGQMSCGEFASEGRGIWIFGPLTSTEYAYERVKNPIHWYRGYSGPILGIFQEDSQLVPIVYHFGNKFITNHLVYFSSENELKVSDLSNFNTKFNATLFNYTLERIDGLVWLQSDFKYAVYFPPSIKDSMFTKLFFYNAERLDNFELVYSTPEVKLFKVI